MMKVVYQWSEDGESEFCELHRIFTEKAEICYHCGQAITVGQPAALLRIIDDEYLLHCECALKSCSARYIERLEAYLKQQEE